MKNLITSVLLTVLFSNKICGQYDTLTKLIPDNFSLYPKMSTQIFSLNKPWVAYDTLDQTILFEINSYYSSIVIYYFNKNNIHLELREKLELYFLENKFENVFDLISYRQKETSFNVSFNSLNTRINQSYFKTKQGIKLGDKKEKAINIFGKSDRYSVSKEIEKYEWKIDGEYKNEFNIETMFFKNNILIAMIRGNYIL